MLVALKRSALFRPSDGPEDEKLPPPLAMPLPLAQPAAPTPSYCKFCKSKMPVLAADPKCLGKTTVPRDRTAEIAEAVG